MNCSGKYAPTKSPLYLHDKILGTIEVHDTEYLECEGCGKKKYSAKTLRDIEAAEDKRLRELLLKRPLGDFILGQEVADILGCSRQAVHKHKRIRRGFIHFVKFNNQLQYLKESVFLFKETGDGRCPLVPERIEITTQEPHTIIYHSNSEPVRLEEDDSLITLRKDKKRPIIKQAFSSLYRNDLLFESARN